MHCHGLPAACSRTGDATLRRCRLGSTGPASPVLEANLACCAASHAGAFTSLDTPLLRQISLLYSHERQTLRRLLFLKFATCPLRRAAPRRSPALVPDASDCSASLLQCP